MSYVKTYYKSKSGEQNLTTNFKVKEFACKDGTDKILIDMEMLPILQKIRDLLGTTIINSAYRTENYNKQVGGAKNSYHKLGMAFDIKCANGTLLDICGIAKAIGVKGIILYSTFVHIDNRATQYHYNNLRKNNQNFTLYKIPFSSNIKNGTKGTDVGIVQFKLNSLDYNCGTVDSICGTKTIKAIKEFQKNNNLKVDGICGVNTWTKLFN